MKTNRSAIGAPIKVVTAGSEPRTIHSHISSGSSFGGNPLEQFIGLGDAPGIERIEIHWPTSGTTQIFENPPLRQVFQITELNDDYEIVTPRPIEAPQTNAGAPSMQAMR